MSSDQTIKILRLDHSRADRAFSGEESLWDDEISRMEKLIVNHVELMGEKDEGIASDAMSQLSIGIFGSPGSGKTSLVETFRDRVNKEPKSLPDNLRNKIYSLPVIKPNILAKDEHFFYKFLATSLTEARRKRNSKGTRYRESSILSPLQQTFQEVSEYLQAIDETGRKQGDDPLGVSLDRLERHESGVKLEEKMADFIEQLANGLGGPDSVVLMPVDDADLAMETLISAISTCRRFLQHPRLIPIFTFTGRLAEELLRVHFEEKLTIKGNASESEKLKEASTSLLVTENMAIQYLGKLFPVRNRIRMGPASARVLSAKYVSTEYERTLALVKKDAQGEITEKIETTSEFAVLELLETVSILLFGHSRVPIVPTIRPPLRMVTLRRQLQIVDAMQAAGIEALIPGVNRKGVGDGKEVNRDSRPNKSWGQSFDLATWSLLNTHRDVLKEIKMNLDDLYGWTPKGLRQVILDSILKMPLEERRKLIKHWRYRTEDRRSQIISLLAANVFRPRMFGEEPTGDEPGAIPKWQDHLNLKKHSNVPDSKFNKRMSYNKDSLSTSKGLLWFINLCIGFYIPQILACNRSNKISETHYDKLNTGSISGIGWDIVSGPIHAVREALQNKKVFSTGMLFLDPVHFNNSIWEIRNKNVADSVLYINIWSFYGFREGKPWAAVSLWRGLGLMAQLLTTIKYHDDDAQGLMRIKTILKKHLDSALVLGNLPSGEQQKTIDEQNCLRENSKTSPQNQQEGYVLDRAGVIFPKWSAFDEEYKTSENKENYRLEDAVTKMAELLQTWLKKFKPTTDSTSTSEAVSTRIFPMLENVEEDDQWKRCFTRRLHGENVMSIFWQDLENKYYQKPLGKWNLYLILDNWFTVLEEYWRGCLLGNSNESGETDSVGIDTLFIDCPLIKGEDGELLKKYKDSLSAIKRETIHAYSVCGSVVGERRRSKAKETDGEAR